MKSFQDALEYRRSVRVFKKDPIDVNIVKQCVQNATLSPNSSNLQTTQYIHVVSPDILEQMVPICLSQLAAKTAQQMVVLVTRRDWIKSHARQNYDFIVSQKDMAYKDHAKGYKMALNYYSKLILMVHRTGFLGVLGIIKYMMMAIIGRFRPIYRQMRLSDSRVVAHKSAGIAAQTFMLSMASYGYDTCPMEGLDTGRLKKLLNLPAQAEINMVIGCGLRQPEGVWGPRFRVPFEQVYKSV